VKADLFEPLVFGAVLAVLLAVRLAGRLRRGGAAPGAPAKPLPVNQ
jgi:hypothetical protein